MSGFSGRIALLCDFDDPAAQLLAAELRPADVVPVLDVPEEGFDHLIILSQTLFLLHASKLGGISAKISVVLRRRSAAETHLEWAEGLEIAAQTLVLMTETSVALYALSERAASHTGAAGLAGILLWPQQDSDCPRIDRAVVDVEKSVITLDGVAARSMKIDALNWAALARRAQLTISGGSSEDMRDVLAFSNRASLDRGEEAIPTYVIVVPNGVGLGHLTRMLAIARGLGRSARLIFWCFSRAALVIKQAGYPVFVRQTASHLGIDGEDWRAWETQEFADLLRQCGARKVIYDGSTIDAFITRAIRQPGLDQVDLIWMRRAMWQEGSDASVIEGAQFCDAIVEPGDLAAEADKGPTTHFVPQHRGFSRLVKAGPVTLMQPDDQRTRRAARKHLGLGRGFYCLINLGADHFVDRTILTAQIAEIAAKHQVQLVWAQSPLAAPTPELDQSGTALRQYPLARDYAAFDGVVSAAGYNSFHELMMLYAGPVLFAPTRHARLDDQPARAGYANSRGWADVLDSGSSAAGQFRTLDNFFAEVRNRSGAHTRSSFQSGISEICQVISAPALTGREDD
ncbi:MAG: hypothetical protein JXQ97_15645 [Natronospirillum sp.]